MAEQYLHELYYNPESPASFGGVDAVYCAARNDGKYILSRNKIKKWLKQTLRTLCINPCDIVLEEIELLWGRWMKNGRLI